MNTNNTSLTTKQQKKKQKLLYQMEKEIKKLQYEIRYSKLTNMRIHALRAAGISLRFLQLIAPFAITAGLVFGGFSLLGYTPFVIDDQKKKLEKETTIDSLGNVSVVEQYDDFDKTNTISYIGQYELQEDGLYARKVKTYAAAKVAEDVLRRIVNDEDIDSLEEVLGKPVSVRVEKSNNITEEEKNSPAYLQASIYSVDNNDVIIVKESVGDNVGTTLIVLLLTLIFEILPALVRIELSDFDFSEAVESIQSNLQLVDVDSIQRRLAIKKDTFERLTRN